MLKLGSIARIKTYEEILEDYKIRTLKNGIMKVGTMILDNNLTQYVNKLMVVKIYDCHKVSFASGAMNAIVSSPIDGYEEFISCAVRYVFNYYIEHGYVRAERTRGKVIMYDKDNFEEIRDKILESIRINDFSMYSDREIMAMAKAVDYTHQKFSHIDIRSPELKICPDSLDMDIVYSYLQFNMDFKIVDGIITSSRIPIYRA